MAWSAALRGVKRRRVVEEGDGVGKRGVDVLGLVFEAAVVKAAAEVVVGSVGAGFGVIDDDDRTMLALRWFAFVFPTGLNSILFFPFPNGTLRAGKGTEPLAFVMADGAGFHLFGAGACDFLVFLRSRCLSSGESSSSSSTLLSSS